MEQHTKADEYVPTANERKVIETMMEPENRFLNITELCKAAGISRDSYYQMFKRPSFVEYYKRIQFESIKGNVARVLSATVEFAVTDPKCHQDRKMILEMGEMYTERIKQEHSGEGGGALEIVFSDKMRPKEIEEK